MVQNKDLERLKKIFEDKGIKLTQNELLDVSTHLFNLIKNLYLTK